VLCGVVKMRKHNNHYLTWILHRIRCKEVGNE
jgi:hypothetical protein